MERLVELATKRQVRQRPWQRRTVKRLIKVTIKRQMRYIRRPKHIDKVADLAVQNKKLNCQMRQLWRQCRSVD